MIMAFSIKPNFSTISYILCLFSILIASPIKCSFIGNGSECLVHFKDGDLIIGGIVPVYQTNYQSCDGPIMERHGVPKIETMVYAIEMVNSRSDVLPNVTLGYDIRNDCREEDTSLWASLTMTDPCGENTFQRLCPPHNRFNTSYRESRTVVGIIGPGSSSTSLFVARAAAIYEVPTIAYSASSDSLSDKNLFPYYFRTVPPDRFQAKVIIDLLLRYNWEYVALYSSTDTYGSNGAKQVRKFANGKVCIAIDTPIPSNTASNTPEWNEIVSNLKNAPLISVVVLFSLSVPAKALMETLSKGDLGRKITFIGSDDLSGNEIIDAKVGDLIHGSFYPVPHSHPDPGFRQHWDRLDEDANMTTSPWYHSFAEYWKSRHSCASMASCPLPPLSESTVINGVLAMAHGLDATISQSCQHTSVCNATLSGQNLRDNLLNVTFPTGDGIFAFDENGETSGKYDIWNLQKKDDGEYVFKVVGQWFEGTFRNFTDVQWGLVTNDTPISVCREACEPGAISVPLEKACCWGCRSCPDDSMINGTNCQQCPFKHWPNANFTECAPLEPDYLDWHEPAIVIIVLFSCMGILVTILVAVEFYIHREIPLIKATSRELVVIIMCGLLLSFVTPFVIAAPPSYASCKISEIFTAFSFLLIFGPTSLKVTRIFRIFRKGKKSARRLKLISPADQIGLLAGLISVQTLILILSLFISPSEPHYIEANLLKGSLNLYCRYGYGFVASVVYNFILIVACCFFAFRTRKVPSNYNESRFIAISVYSTLIVCLSAVPVYFTATSVLYKVATISTALILNGYLTLVLLFLPKIYAVKFVGSNVNVESWRVTTTGGSMHVANSSSVISTGLDNRAATVQE